MKKLYKDQILGIIGMIIAILASVATMQIPKPKYEGDPGAAVIPWIAVILIACCSILLIVRPSKEERTVFMTKEEWKRAALLFGCYIIYLLLFWLIGFVPTIPIVTFLFTFVLTQASMEGETLKKRIIKSAIFAVIASVCIILIYKYGLKTQLPRGMIRKWFKF